MSKVIEPLRAYIESNRYPLKMVYPFDVTWNGLKKISRRDRHSNRFVCDKIVDFGIHILPGHVGIFTCSFATVRPMRCYVVEEYDEYR